ncbi:TPA: hypothetical protein ACH3X1_004392 [Trebouxia sp. C0004]
MAVTQDVRNKVVVRKLPPGISQEEVQAAIDAVCQGKYDWFTFVPGKVSLKRVKHSRAYLNFLDAAEVLRFRAQFGGHAFVNKKGAQYKCTVEYAPYQKVPREKAKEDPREGTYEIDADFMAFKQQAEGDPELLPSAEVQLELKEQAKKALTETSSKPKVTPLMQFLHDRHSLKLDKKPPILVHVKKKSSKTNADLDLPPHLANKAPPSSQTTPSKPPSNHQQTPMSRSSNSKPSVLPISVSDASQPLSGSKGKKAYDQGKGHGRLDEEESAASSRNGTPSRKAKQQRGQEGKGQSAKAETAAAPAIAVLRKVVPIKLERPSRRGEAQAGPSDAANHSNDAQDGDKPSKKVRPGFQTWAPRRGGRGEEEEAENAGPPGVHALTAARAAAAAALRAENKAAGRLAQSQADQGSSPGVHSQGGRDPEPNPQPANSGWGDEPPPHLAASCGRGRGRGRGGSSRGRAGLVAQHSAASEGWGGDSSAGQPGQDGWGYPVSPDPQGKLHLANVQLVQCCSVDA